MSDPENKQQSPNASQNKPEPIILESENMDPNEKVRILYVDDEEHNLKSFRATFRRDYIIDTVTSAEEGLKLIEENPYHIIITDQRMPNMTGVEFLEKIIPKNPEEDPNPIRMLLTGFTDINAVIDSINKGKVYNYIAKPWNADELKILIDNAAEVYRLREYNKLLRRDLKKVNQQLEFMVRQKLIS